MFNISHLMMTFKFSSGKQKSCHNEIPFYTYTYQTSVDKDVEKLEPSIAH